MEMVRIRSTEELPTCHDGVKGQVWKRWSACYPDFFIVLVWTTGETCVFHESQLRPL